jgi:hypothetical protein
LVFFFFPILWYRRNLRNLKNPPERISGEESREEIFLEILKLKSFRIWISSGTVSGKVKMIVEVGDCMVRYGFIGFLRRNSGKGSYFRWTFLR